MGFKLKDRVRRFGQHEVCAVEDIREPDEHILRLNPAVKPSTGYNLAVIPVYGPGKVNLRQRNERTGLDSCRLVSRDFLGHVQQELLVAGFHFRK
jgi:hypothetical protein